MRILAGIALGIAVGAAIMLIAHLENRIDPLDLWSGSAIHYFGINREGGAETAPYLMT
jgi:hypothetical protein